MKKIIRVLIQGETDWLTQDYSQSELNRLMNPSSNLGETGALIGRILDGSKTEPISEDTRAEIRTLLGSYVANTVTYKMVKAFENSTIFITSFKSLKGYQKGYVTRVAGSVQGDAESDTKNMTAEDQYMCLLHLLKTNAHYKHDPYLPSSAYHKLMNEARQVNVNFIN